MKAAILAFCLSLASASASLSIHVYPQRQIDSQCNYVLVTFAGQSRDRHTLQESCDGGRSWQDIGKAVWSWNGLCTWGLWEHCTAKLYRVRIVKV